MSRLTDFFTRTPSPLESVLSSVLFTFLAASWAILAYYDYTQHNFGSVAWDGLIWAVLAFTAFAATFNAGSDFRGPRPPRGA